MYQEEDSYINPSNVSKINNSGFDAENDSFVQGEIISKPKNSGNPYGSGNKKRGKNGTNNLLNAMYQDINNSNVLVDGNLSLGGSNRPGEQLINQSLYDDQL